MNRVVVAVIALIAVAGACTLILDTKEIIQPCTNGSECEAGFDCVENACLPTDEAAEGEGEDEE